MLASLALVGPADTTALAQDNTSPTALPEIKVIGTTPLSSPRTSRRAALAKRAAPARPSRRIATRERAPAPPPQTPAPLANSPAPGTIDRDKVPSDTQTLTADDFQRTPAANVPDVLFRRVSGISLSDPNGNTAQQEIKYRGFYASPVQGTPQGLAVYLAGIRLNEAFGDTVNWDLIPTNALERADVWSSNPVFGLNALGGAINLTTKSGFTYHGAEAEVTGGSYGRLATGAQFGGEGDGYALYLAAQGLTDRGWRQHSPTELARFYGDLGWRGDRGELHLIAGAASSYLGAVAATPVQLLARDWSSVFTTPQSTRNDMVLTALGGRFDLSDTWSLQSNLYVRRFKQAHVDGNFADLERCSALSSYPSSACLQDDGYPRPNPVTTAYRNQFVVLDQNNMPIPCPPGSGNTCARTPYGTIDRTSIRTVTAGASLQAANNDDVLGHNNHFTVGGSVDHSSIGFDASSELGYVFPDLSVGENPAIPGSGAIIHTAGNLGYGPVGLRARSTYSGLFATDTLDVSERLSATLGARFNLAQIGMTDLLGTSPELNSSPNYARLNPLAGLTYKLTPTLTAYGGYSESNRAPTPLELGCSSASKPCLLEGFLVADPPLKQVVGRTYETGLRGERGLGSGKLSWKAGLFRTDLTDDITNLASPIQGRGYFQNVPGTRRQGFETAAEYRTQQWSAYANYSFIDATYRFTADLASPNNPMADENGNVHVVPGSQIPMIPRHQFKMGGEYAVTSAWTIGADAVAVSSQFFAGDEANQNEKLPAYWVANLHTSYRVSKNVELLAAIHNLFNRRYGLYGTYCDPASVANVPLGVTLTDHRTEVPGQPFAIYVGLRARS